VLCITHLPQIAALADAHFHIAKTVTGGRTITSVHRLSGQGRVDEVGRMLSGDALTDAVRRLALAMIDGSSGTSAGETGPVAKGESNPKGESERSEAKRRRPPR
jgi:hypothetical protein